MSPATIDRLLRPHRQARQRGLSANKSAAFIKSQIPIELLTSRVTKPGMVEADTVAHCGNSLVGEFANSLTVTDLFSGWTENRAMWGKTSAEVIAKIREMRGSMPFKLSGFACDNGTEFINYDMIKYFRDRKNGIVKFVRRRPDKKNDNAHVEQKNDTHVRQLFGYSRLDSIELVDLMNDIYKNYWGPLNNLFCPVMKLKAKTRIGGKIKKIYDTPATACDRLLHSGALTELQVQNLQLTRQSLSPIKLREALDEKLKLFTSQLTRNQVLGEVQTLISSAS